MSDQHGEATRARDLRRGAETLRQTTHSDLGQMTSEDVQSLVHELEVHQIELEIQNEELRRVQLELEESRDLFSDLYDFAPIGYVSLDPDGAILRANLTAGILLGVDRDQLTRRKLSDSVVTEDQDGLHFHLRKVFGAGSKQICELGLHRDDGVLVDARLESIVEQRRGGSPQQCRVALIDITERKRAEAERGLLEAEVQQAQKLESMGLLAGGIAHDFNNLLTTILGSAALATTKLGSASPAVRWLDRIRIASERGAALCGQMLSYAGKGSFLVETFSLTELVREMAGLAEMGINKAITVRYRLAEELPPIEADRTQVGQIVMNLISNASEAIGEESGVITIQTGLLEAKDARGKNAFAADRRAEGAFVYLAVSDTGCGMDEEEKAKMFDPFFTTKFSGRGLGLAAVRGIVACHHGLIELESKTGRGTKFTVLLPGAPGAKVTTVQEQGPLDEWRGEGTVLVIDDEPGVRAVAKAMLEWRGLDVLTASNGFQGVEIFRERSAQILAVLLDMTMPGMDGKATLQELRRIQPDVGVVLASGYEIQVVLKSSSEGERIAALQKPYLEKDLIAALREVTQKDLGPL